MQVEQHQSAEIKDTKTVELLFNGESKTGQLAVSPSEDYWNSLEKLYHASFPSIESGAAIQAKYIDDEGDLIVLDSDDELRIALNNAAINPLRLEVFFAQDQSEKNKRIKKTREERLRLKADRLKAKEEEKLNLGDGDQEKIQKKRARIEEKLKRKQERQEKKKEKEQDLSHEQRVALKEEKLKRREEKKMKREEKKRMQGLEEEGDTSRHEEKMKRREDKMKKREEKKMKRKAATNEEKQHRREERSRNGDKTGIAFFDLANENAAWPEHATQLFLDGNNMMFVTGGLRNLTLHHNRSKAEQLLEAAAQAFVISQADKIQQATVIFDNTRTDKSVTLGEGSSSHEVAFRVCSARPQWPTSDDALIEWAKDAQKKKQEEGSGPGADCMAVVTSDRGLSVQLQQAGATLIKPKQFLHFAFKTVTAKNENDSGDTELDAWLESLLA